MTKHWGERAQAHCWKRPFTTQLHTRAPASIQTVSTFARIVAVHERSQSKSSLNLAIWRMHPDCAAPINYTLTVVAKTGDTISGKTLTGFKLPSLGANSPAINASGRVAFYATYSEGVYVGEGIFT